MIALVLSAALALAPAPAARASLEEAIDLYHAARFAEALQMLDDLEAGTNGSAPPAEASGPITEYRALCLLALDRETEARTAIEKLIRVDPIYRPRGDLPPRLSSLVERVRGEILPGVVRAEYRQGKESFDRGDNGAARGHFQRVIALLDGAPAGAESTETLGDMKDLAGGFLLVIDKTAPPPDSPADPAASTAAGPPAVNEVPGETAPPADGVYRAGDTRVVPPVTVRQEFPSWRNERGSSTWARSRAGAKGVLEVTIDENGRVESARLATPVHPLYDPRLLDAARGWEYRPATRDGVPVKYIKAIAIELVEREGQPDR